MCAKIADLKQLWVDRDLQEKFKKFVDTTDLKLQSATERALVEFMQNNRDLAKKKRVK